MIGSFTRCYQIYYNGNDHLYDIMIIISFLPFFIIIKILIFSFKFENKRTLIQFDKQNLQIKLKNDDDKS